MNLYFYTIKKTTPGGIPEFVSSFCTDQKTAIGLLVDCYLGKSLSSFSWSNEGNLVVHDFDGKDSICVFDEREILDNLEITIGNPFELLFTMTRDSKFSSTPLTLQKDLQELSLRLQMETAFPEPPPLLEPVEKPSPFNVAIAMIETFMSWELLIEKRFTKEEFDFYKKLIKEGKEFLREQNKNQK
jgi:hypothetical protein